MSISDWEGFEVGAWEDIMLLPTEGWGRKTLKGNWL
jgi:hypothetical protein